MNTAKIAQLVLVRGPLHTAELPIGVVTVTVIVYGPAWTLVPTTKCPLITLPLLTVHAGELTGLPETEHVGENEPPGHAPAPQVSCPLNPTVEPLAAVAGMSCIVLTGVPLITKFASATSMLGVL